MPNFKSIPSGPSYAILVTTFLAAACVPALFLFFGLSSSTALGSISVAFVSIAILGYIRISSKTFLNIVLTSLATCMLILIHFACVGIFLESSYDKSVYSLCMLGVFIVGGFSIGELILRAEPSKLNSSLISISIIFLVLAICGAFGLFQTIFTQWLKPIFPFSEPSHYANMSAPFLLYLCATINRCFRLLVLLLYFISAILIQSLGMIVVVLIILLFCFHLRWAVVFLIFGIFAFSFIDAQYYVSRLNVSSDNTNLSYLVYFQGWQLIILSLGVSGLLGIGFQQLGILSLPVTDASLRISQSLGNSFAESNSFDGGFMMAKIISEFGIFGIFFCLILVAIALKSGLKINHFVRGRINASPSMLMASCFIFSYSLELLLRGVGYFSSPSLFLLSAFYVLYRHSVSGKCFS